MANGAEAATAYEAVDGSMVPIPPLRPLEDGERARFGAADGKALVAALTPLFEKLSKSAGGAPDRAARKNGRFEDVLAKDFPDRVVALFNGETPLRAMGADDGAGLIVSHAPQWLAAAFARMPQAQALPLAAALANGLTPRLNGLGTANPVETLLWDYIWAPNGDLRQIGRLDQEVGAQWRDDEGRVDLTPSETTRWLLRAASAYETGPSAFPQDALWPLIAENLPVIDEMLALWTATYEHPLAATAAQFLGELPKAPMRALPALVRAGLLQAASKRDWTRAMLKDAPGATALLTAALEDDKAATRARAAEWLGQRRDADAVSALKARLDAETSAPARAAMMTALEKLGAPQEVAIDAAALIKEAEAAAKAIKPSKLLKSLAPTLPRARFRDGAEAGPAVLTHWLHTAIAVEAPGGAPMIDRRLDALDPEDAQAFSLWCLRGWIAYDTAKPTDAEATKKAQKAFGGQAVNDAALEAAKARVLRKYTQNGYSARGVLACAVRAPDAEAGFLIRDYLSRHGVKHGTRSAQGRALLELAARIAGPACLESLAWARGQTKHETIAVEAAHHLETIRRARGWSADALEDRTAPDLGFDADGRAAFPVREGAPDYALRLEDDLTVALLNPSGRVVKAPPTGKDDEAKEARKRFTALKKHIAATIAAQTDRFFAAMCWGREWPLADWRRFVHGHPILGRLAQRLIWVGVDAAGRETSFRPTAEGDFTDAEDAPVALAAGEGDEAAEGQAGVRLRLAHRSILGDAAAEAWRAHLVDYEITPPFDQLSRPLLEAPAAAPPAAAPIGGWRVSGKAVGRITEGWDQVIDGAALLREAGRRGFAPPGAGRAFYDFPELRRGVGPVWAVIAAQGPSPREGGPVRLFGLEFNKPLASLPPILLSEVWRDYREVIAAAADPRAAEPRAD